MNLTYLDPGRSFSAAAEPVKNSSGSLHWSTCLIALGAIVSLVGLIAGIILSSTLLIAGASFYFATSALGTYYAFSYHQVKPLSDQSNTLAERVRTISSSSDTLQKANLQLQNNIQDLQAERDLLNHTLQKHSIDLAKTVGELNLVNEHLKQSEAKFNKDMSQLQQKLDQRTQELQKTTDQLDKAEAKFKISISSLKDENSQLQNAVTELNLEISKLGSINKAHLKQLEALKKGGSEFSAELIELDKESSKQLDPEKLKKLLKKIEEATGRLKDAASQVFSVDSKLNHSSEETAKLLERVAKLLNKPIVKDV